MFQEPYIVDEVDPFDTSYPQEVNYAQVKNFNPPSQTFYLDFSEDLLSDDDSVTDVSTAIRRASVQIARKLSTIVTEVEGLSNDFTTAFNEKGDVQAAIRRASVQVARKLSTYVTEFETVSEESQPASPVEAKGPLRVLMLHGYTQSGEFFSAKTRRLREGIIANIKDELSIQHPEGIEFLYPDAPALLKPSDIPGHNLHSPDSDELRGWFNINDEPFTGLEQSLDYIINYMRSVGHIDGVIGFSQGGAMAMMIASLCEGQTNPKRLEALANQPVSMTFEPPQGPMKFAVSMSGFRGRTDRYDGFYNPIITTPAMCVIADLDTMIDEEISIRLVGSIAGPEVIRHSGGHYVPTDKKSINKVSGFIRDRVVDSFAFSGFN